MAHIIVIVLRFALPPVFSRLFPEEREGRDGAKPARRWRGPVRPSGDGDQPARGGRPGALKTGRGVVLGSAIVLRGGGSMMVSGNVDAVRDVWVAALSRMVAAEGQRAINVATLGGRS